ncbi:MAG TPA: outer membrane protein assembly factor BamA [Thermoanaerobaculia bacterium]|jgi:outer membrane protein insertion porin family|nr:outer membrane protein assembly factor BamA [Thermoanaerobaculia bacterium]
MTRILVMLAVLAIAGRVARAQTAPTQERPKPRPGVILDSPSTGRITDAPTTKPEQQLSGQTVERFEAVGNSSVASDTIRVYLGIVPGEAYVPEAIQRNFTNLWQTGLFDDIRVEVEPGEAGGVVVKAFIRERPRIGSVEFRGNKELNQTKINEALEREKIDLHVGSTIEQTLVKRAAEAVKRAYTEGGFEGVSVDTITEDLGEPGEKKIVFIINEGVKAKIGQIDFIGNRRFSDGKLRSQMKEIKKHNLITWVRKKNLYIPSKLDEDLERVKNYYQDFGYQDVSFGDPQIVTAGKRVKVTIPVKEGEIHTFGEVSVEGNTVFTNEQIIGNWPLKKGDTLGRKPIQTRVDAFGDAYRMRGYIYAYVDPEYTDKGNNVVDVKLRVFEGDQFRLGRLEFTGNSTTKDKVLRREVFIEEGSIMDMETFKQSVYKLGQLGYFKVTENPDFKVNPDSKTVDITVKGVEEGKNDIQFGGGYSEGGGFFVQAQFATRNFLGEGENFSLGYQRGRRTNFFSISYADPWFMDTPNSLGVSIYNRETVLPASFGYEQRGKGGTVAYGYRLRRFDSVGLLYGYERSRSVYQTQEVPDPQGNLPMPLISDLNFVTSTIVPSYRYDSRDNPFDTARGSRFNLSFAYAGGPLGGSVDMFKPTVGATRFFRLSRRSSISANVEAGYIFSFRDDCAHTYNELSNEVPDLCVPTSDRFLVGGEFSVRGFGYGTLGPYEEFPGRGLRPAGGYSYQTYNFEYLYRVNDPIRLVLFADAGRAYGYQESIDFGKLRYSFGAELRLFLPVFQFPLRFIYAINPAPEDADEFEGFQFTIGNTF